MAFYYYASREHLGNKSELVQVGRATNTNHIAVARSPENAINSLLIKPGAFVKGKYPVFLYIIDGTPSTIQTKELIKYFDYGEAKITDEEWIVGEVKLEFFGKVILDESKFDKLEVQHRSRTITINSYKYNNADEVEGGKKASSMDWLTYYIKALNNKMYLKRKWYMDVFSVKKEYKEPEKWHIGLDLESKRYYTNDEGNNRVYIEGVKTGEPPISFWRSVELNKDSLPNVKEKVVTTTGEMLVNYIAFIDQFHDEVEYKTGKITTGLLTGVMSELRTKGTLTADNILKATSNIHNLETFCDIAVPAASRNAFKIDKSITKRRAELLKANKKDLDNPVVQAKIDKELVAMDKKVMTEDVAGSFYTSNKTFATVRKKLYFYYGAETGLDGRPGKFNQQPLVKGWNTEQFTDMVNSTRMGVEARGKLTALGGLDMKNAQRILSTYQIVEDDCGSKEGLKLNLNATNIKEYIGRYRLDKDQPLKISDLNSLIGQTIYVRDPSRCKTAASGFCGKCMGDLVKAKKKAIPLECSNLGAVSQNAMMQAAHGKAVETVDIVLDTFFT